MINQTEPRPASFHFHRIALIFPFTLAFLLIGTLLFVANGPTQARVVTDEEALARPEETAFSTIFLPLVVKDRPVFRDLGVASQVGASYACAGQTCYDLQITCSQISRPILATLKVGEPFTPSNPFKGTILFETGWTGTYFWAGDGSGALASSVPLPSGIDLSAMVSNNSDIINTLRADGFRTVQLKWQTTWFEAESGHVEGMGSLACRPATVTKWVYDNLHQKNTTAPFCATGHSNGASQLAYSISHYGLSDILSTAVFESGPNWSNIDHACLYDDLAYQSIYADDGERGLIDWGFGFLTNGTGPCSLKNVNYRSAFQEANLIQDSRDFSYPKTLAKFIFGGLDPTTTYNQGQLFYDRLAINNTILVTQTIVPTADHEVTADPAGALAMENALRTECVLR